MADSHSTFCRICGKPVSLTSNMVVDEDGKAVHEECYVKEVRSDANQDDPDNR
jgi:hypothetical protein